MYLKVFVCQLQFFFNFQDTDDIGFISPSVALAMVGAIALGFGDACLNTQIIALLGTLYSNDAESVFSLYLFVQSIAVTLSFFYSNYFGLHLQLGILIVVGLLGTITFVVVDLKSKDNDSIIPVGVENKTVESPVELETVKRY